MGLIAWVAGGFLMLLSLIFAQASGELSAEGKSSWLGVVIAAFAMVVGAILWRVA